MPRFEGTICRCQTSINTIVDLFKKIYVYMYHVFKKRAYDTTNPNNSLTKELEFDNSSSHISGGNPTPVPSFFWIEGCPDTL